MTILDLLTASVRDRPGHTALVIDGHRLTFAQIEERSRRVAAFLSARGFTPGDRLAIFLENEVAFVDAYFGALRAGIVVVPTNPLYRDRDAKIVWDDAEVRGIVSGGELAAEVKKIGLGDRLIDAAEIAAAATSFAVPAEWREFDARPETIAFILFTSGTTGRAKGAMQSHNALAASAAQIRTAWHWRDDDVLCIALPLFHVHGLHVAMQTTLAVGATVVVERRFDAQKMCETLVREKATMFFGVPTMYVRFLERLEKGALPQLRLWLRVRPHSPPRRGTRSRRSSDRRSSSIRCDRNLHVSHQPLSRTVLRRRRRDPVSGDSHARHRSGVIAGRRGR